MTEVQFIWFTFLTAIAAYLLGIWMSAHGH